MKATTDTATPPSHVPNKNWLRRSRWRRQLAIPKRQWLTSYMASLPSGINIHHIAVRTAYLALLNKHGKANFYILSE